MSCPAAVGRSSGRSARHKRARLRGSSAAENRAASRLGIDIKKSPNGSRLACEPSVFPLGGVFAFAREVVTGLPYYTVPAPGQGEPYVRYMIDEQRLLGLKVRVPWVDAGPVTCRKNRRARLRTATWEMSMYSPSETGAFECKWAHAMQCWNPIVIVKGFELCEIGEVATW